MRSSKGSKYSSYGTVSSKRSSTKYASAGYAPSTSYSSGGYTSASGYGSYGGYGSSGYGSYGGYSSSSCYGSSSGYGSTAGYDPSTGDSTYKKKSSSKKQGSGVQLLDIMISANDTSESHNQLHVGLQIEYRSEDSETREHTFLHVIGGPGYFRREERRNWDATESRTFIDRVHVAAVRASGPSDTRLRDTILNTRVKNNEDNWYCQHYVGDALENCVAAGLITEGQLDRAIDKMADTLIRLTDN
ncbi:hypothetical protein GGR58DRAFT_524619 [Xylaria digitata]|nr:hypothetical protein GGR58DRAFT_524619 [Xylaria digitata]